MLKTNRRLRHFIYFDTEHIKILIVFLNVKNTFYGHSGSITYVDVLLYSNDEKKDIWARLATSHFQNSITLIILFFTCSALCLDNLYSDIVKKMVAINLVKIFVSSKCELMFFENRNFLMHVSSVVAC